MLNHVLNDRDARIDYIRVIGTLLVILAHMGVPVLLQNIRTFDVVSLVFISGYSFMFHEHNDFYQYIIKRMTKLLIPTYLLLIILFVSVYIGSLAFGFHNPFSLDIMIHSFIFLDSGIGYIWIVKVYLITAIALFFLNNLIRKFPIVMMSISFLMIFALGELFSIIYGKSIAVDSYICNVVPYVFVAIIGAATYNLKKIRLYILLASGCAYLLYQIVFIDGFTPDLYKYPPQMYYVCYGLLVSVILMYVVPTKNSFVITWMSNNSFLVYLTHIFYLLALQMVASSFGLSILKVWWVKYLAVLFLSFISAIFINLCINKWKSTLHRTN